jgi:hypothetical protein
MKMMEDARKKQKENIVQPQVVPLLLLQVEPVVVVLVLVLVLVMMNLSMMKRRCSHAKSALPPAATLLLTLSSGGLGQDFQRGGLYQRTCRHRNQRFCRGKKLLEDVHTHKCIIYIQFLQAAGAA